MRYLIIAVCCILLFYPIYHNERLKYQHALFDCMETYSANEDLLDSKVCTNLYDRLRHKKAGTVQCDKAEHDNRIVPSDCALQRWWLESEIVHMYHRITSSYWSIVPLICFAMYLYYRKKMNEWSENKFYEKQEQFVKHITLPKVPFGAKVKNKRRKRKHEPPIMQIK